MARTDKGTRGSPRGKWHCRECGGQNVQVLDWIDPNKHSLIGGYWDDGGPDNLGDTWCDDCQENAGVCTDPYGKCRCGEG